MRPHFASCRESTQAIDDHLQGLGVDRFVGVLPTVRIGLKGQLLLVQAKLGIDRPSVTTGVQAKPAANAGKKDERSSLRIAMMKIVLPLLVFGLPADRPYFTGSNSTCRRFRSGTGLPTVTTN